MRTFTGCDLIIFDCDGVLVDSEMLAIRAMCGVLNEADIPATESMILRCFGMKQLDTLRRIAAETGREIPPNVAERLWPATRSAFEASLRPMPGIFDVLDLVTGPKRCVASSSHPERIATSLALTGLASYFGDSVFSSHQVVRGKPAPDLFLFAAASMSVDPARCVVIEDSAFGIEGARAAGMTPYGFTGGAHIQAGHDAALRQAGAVAVEATWEAMSGRLLGSCVAP
ncbi:HAD family hydrolase [Lichenifustis flavocetrariae]|uniref:HAD family hydrolase n=1 Tax=Lichenifustis flavocetrariae TaxID=2949735 RepID=A0AA41YZY9_9HYPH|nr:HAD family hydrolase [Lichenifustis flavocetrariae]MCW6508003.1 HAD family hydrolase [Lichenifustis flavocetrariae]